MPTTFKPFKDMTPEDYANIGFMSGLEVHQQLLTKRKLFCRCPAGRYTSEYDAEVLRHMRPTLSELGEYDGTALMEKKTRKNIFYRMHHETTCTYEFDDTPPFFPDDLAIDIALEVCMLCSLSLVGEMHIARKQYLDGSIPTGFQRTAILGVGGSIPYQNRRIGIRQLSLEEDACREVSDIGHDRIYRTDRLGMPLIEVVTEPDMRTPTELAGVNQLIRLLLRSTGKVRMGYGATRQDVNISVRGGTRVEVKGVPQITRIPLLAYNEARRQWSLLKIREELLKRGITPETFAWRGVDVTRAIAKTAYQPIREALHDGRRVRAVVLPGFAGLLQWETQERTTFAKEFADRVRVIACLTKLPNIVHSDSAADLLRGRDWKAIHKRTRDREGDALILVWGDEQDARTACEEIAIRAKQATEGIPSDTRQALADGTNGFERVLPGAERMYPDTDLPPIEIVADRVDRIAAALPTAVWDRLTRYRRMHLPADVVELLSISPRADLFDRITGDLGVDPTFAAVTLIQQFKALRREGLDPTSLRDDELLEMFQAHARGRLERAGLSEVIDRAVRQTGEVDFTASRVAALIDTVGGDPIDDDELDACIATHVRDLKRGPFPTLRKKHRFLMGRLMAELRGKVAPLRAAGRLAEAIGITDEDRQHQGATA